MDEAQYQQLMQMLQMYGGTPNNTMMQPYTQNVWNQQAVPNGQITPYFNPNQQIQPPTSDLNFGASGFGGTAQSVPYFNPNQQVQERSLTPNIGT